MRQLGQLEAAVMERLWTAPTPSSVRDVLDVLDTDKPLAYTTVMTVLDNLHRKGFVSREKEGRAYRYRPTLSREEHAASLLELVLAESSDRGATLLTFVGQLSVDEQDELRAALDRLDAGGTP